MAMSVVAAMEVVVTMIITTTAIDRMATEIKATEAVSTMYRNDPLHMYVHITIKKLRWLLYQSRIPSMLWRKRTSILPLGRV